MTDRDEIVQEFRGESHGSLDQDRTALEPSRLVDQLGEVIEIEIDAAHVEVPPGTVTSCARELVRGAYELDSALLLALGVPRAVECRPRPPRPRSTSP